MSGNARRDRERARTRGRIVDAALHILEAEGVAALTMRRIAGDIEYSAPIVYQHFANKDALVLELVTYGHEMMLAEFRRAAEKSVGDHLVAQVAAEYVRFAAERPHLYELMNAPVLDPEQRQRAAEPTVAFLRALLTAWSDTQGVAVAEPDEACDILWGTLHGITSLGALPGFGAHRAQRLALRAVYALLLGWQHDTPGSERLSD